MEKRMTSGQVLHLFGGEIRGVDNDEEIVICRALSALPITMIEDVIDNVKFLSAQRIYACHFNLTLVREKSLIFISPTTAGLEEDELVKVILHEIGHYINGNEKGEAVADDFSSKYFERL